MRALKGKKKVKYVDLYYEVASNLSEQLAETDVGTLEPEIFDMIQELILLSGCMCIKDDINIVHY